MARLELQFPVEDMPALAARFPDPGDSEAERTGEAARARGHYTRDELLRVIEWKSGGRQRRNGARNDAERVVEVTRVALSARDERLRIAALLTLDGVSWPTASVLLHLAHRDRYPILDVRVLQSLGIFKQVMPNFGFWLEYVDYCRALADRTGMTMRDVDRALWQWSSEAGIPLP